MWTDQVTALCDIATVVRYDVRGFGESSPPAPDVPYAHSDDLVAVLDHLGIASALLVGLSFGGIVVLHTALVAPERVRALVLLDSLLDGVQWDDASHRATVAVNRAAQSHGVAAARDLWLAHPLLATARRDPAVAARLVEMVGDYSGIHWSGHDPARPWDPLTVLTARGRQRANYGGGGRVEGGRGLRARSGISSNAPEVPIQQSLARRAWTFFEPIHAIVYFAPEPRDRYKAAGLRGGWMGYFASRSAPMGAVSSDVVTAVFHNFEPAMVRRAIPDAWRFSTPEAVLAARLDAVDAALRRLWEGETDSPAVAEAAELALDAAAHLREDGRPLYAGHAGLPVPDAPHLALWHACSLLREHRFDGHIAALTVHGLSGIESLVVAVARGKGVDAALLRQFRGWTDEEWSGAEQRLRERGLLDDHAALTAAGDALADTVEDATDRLAEDPWTALSAERRDRLFALLGGLVTRLEAPGGLVYPNPIGVSRPS